jgi:hypothetical protein
MKEAEKENASFWLMKHVLVGKAWACQVSNGWGLDMILPFFVCSLLIFGWLPLKKPRKEKQGGQLIGRETEFPCC